MVIDNYWADESIGIRINMWWWWQWWWLAFLLVSNIWRKINRGHYICEILSLFFRIKIFIYLFWTNHFKIVVLFISMGINRLAAIPIWAENILVQLQLWNAPVLLSLVHILTIKTYFQNRTWKFWFRSSIIPDVQIFCYYYYIILSLLCYDTYLCNSYHSPYAVSIYGRNATMYVVINRNSYKPLTNSDDSYCYFTFSIHSLKQKEIKQTTFWVQQEAVVK